jgi:hypothetical protein
MARAKPNIITGISFKATLKMLLEMVLGELSTKTVILTKETGYRTRELEKAHSSIRMGTFMKVNFYQIKDQDMVN